MPKKGKKLIKVDFTGVSAEGGGRLLPEEAHTFEVVDIEEETGKDSGEPYLAFTLQVVDGEYKGTKAWDNFSLQPQSLWKLRGFMEAAGQDTVDGPMEIDPDELVGLVVVGHVIHEEYKSKTKHRIDSYSPVEGDGAGGGEPEKTTGAVKKKTPAKSESEDETTFKKGDAVKFKDGKKWLEGVLIKVSGNNVEVRVGKDEYEMTVDDIEAA